MISTYSDYISLYTSRPRSPTYPLPGEHHFVAAYLVPRLIKEFGIVPDYINPDGTKSVFGDIVYYRNEAHHFGIEVKSDVVRLTRREFNSWVLETNRKEWPDVFVGVCTLGVACCKWEQFRAAYIAAVKRTKGTKWKPRRVSEGYGPMTQVKFLADELRIGTNWFPFKAKRDAQTWEGKFIRCLAAHAGSLAG